MTRISRFKLPQGVLLKIYQLFFEVMARSKPKEIFLEIINDILSPTERIMIAKRITIIYLLIKGIDQRSIAKTLKVSTSTVSRYAVLIEGKEKGVRKIVENMIKKEKVLDFLEDTFVDLFIQPGFKIGHWDLYWQHKKRKREKETTGL